MQNEDNYVFDKNGGKEKEKEIQRIKSPSRVFSEDSKCEQLNDTK